jgi:Leucine-rich repeat (LRR) protein
MIIVRPSRLQHVAKGLTLTHVKITDEVELNIGRNIFQALSCLTNIVRLDVSELQNRTMDIDVLAFCRGLGQYCPALQHLRLSALFLHAFIDGKGGASWLSSLPELRVLDLRNMDIPTEVGHEILVGCNSSVNLEEVNLSDNNLHHLYEILSDEGSLYIKTLKLDFNGLGSINGIGYFFDEDEDENEIEHDVIGLRDLINDYTSLTALSLKSNAFTNAEGFAIAEYLNTNTNLTHLDLRYNFIEDDIRQRIRDAWHGEPDNLKL